MGDPTHQKHDFEPGIAHSGLVWTIPITPSMLHADADRGRARFSGKNVAVKDFHDFLSAVTGQGPPPIPSHVSFDVRWSGDGHVRKIRDHTFDFGGRYVTGSATVSFTARDATGNVIYKSNPSGQYNPTPKQNGAGLPAVGRERNGIYFP